MTSPRLSEETGRVLGGRYRLVAPVGVGTSARVFLAVDTQLRRRVAVKLLHEALSEDESFLRRFRAEARAAGALSHPNIVAVFDWGEDRSGETVIPYLVTEYLGGGSLRDMLDRGGLLSPSQTLMIGLDTSRALAHAHLRGLVHRDVKPGNLLFDEEGRLRLADFGLARALAEASWTEPTDTTFGAARYASPEQALGRRLDGRSDVYSLALVLTECVTGQVPFTGDTTVSTLTLRTQQDLVLGPEFGGIRTVLQRAGTMDPDNRPEAAEFEIGLMAAAEDLPRPEPLPIVPTLGDGEHTSEMFLARGIANVAPADAPSGDEVSAESAVDETPWSTAPTAPDVPDTPDVPAADEGEAVSGSPAVGAAAIAGAAAGDHGDGAEASADGGGDDTQVVDLSEFDDAEVVLNLRDRERGPIDVAQEYELLAASRPVSFGRVTPYDGDRLPPHHLSPAPGDEPQVSPRRGWRRPFVVVLVLVLLIGAGAGWWFLVRVPTHEVPDFVGQNIELAATRAAQLGWTVDDDTVDRLDGSEPGDVLEQTPPTGERLAEGETVTLVVSLGATLTPMVEVAGSSEDDARAAITAGGLVVGEVSTAHDEEVPAGSVISAVPAPGEPGPDEQAMVPKGTIIDLVVSDGPAPRAVPDDLVGAALNDAKAALAERQLVANVLDEHSEDVVAGFVIRADPDGGEVDRGSTVTLIVSSGPAPVAVPDVRFNTGTAAVATLESQGFTVAGIEGSPSGMVLATDPVAGELVPKGTAVRIFTRS